MKLYNFYLLLIILGAFTVTSCTDEYLDAEPLTERNTDNFYKTPADVYDALVGCYDGMQVAVGGVSGLSYPITSMILSDNLYGGTGNADAFTFQTVDEFDLSRAPAEQNLLEPLWVAYYRGIYRCNSLLQNVNNVEWGTDTALRDQYIAETRVIRSYLYFQMVKLWGNIPLLTEPSPENIEQAEAEEVYKVIAEDLVFASENLPDQPYTSVEAGRITKWAAKSLLGRVYLYYTGYYGATDLVGIVSKDKALQHLEDVIASSGHDLVPDFASLWPAASLEDYAGENNEEVVFSVKLTYTSDYNGNTDGNHWMVMLGMREFASYPYGNGWGITVTPKIYQAFSANDSRRNASIIAIDEENIPFDKINSQREYTGYYSKKYAPLVDSAGTSITAAVGATDFQIGQFQDFFVIRYSDVLLMAAELGSTNAQDYLDKVRSRAFGENFTSVPVSTEAIQNERQLEFALEGIRYWDLLRRGVDVAASIIAESTTLSNGGVATPKTISASNILATKGLQQIPNNQITLSNEVLKQNTGW
ncbi:membrane protein [Marivirga lumbricoides]|uniref:Membrane protein n=1 Tax=Marivirga lumbricoides TaxID=1046115 RepID=A0ABQ1L5R7_9BACT|nr:membrane protein [Marivirga lumbricoides]